LNRKLFYKTQADHT